jgi:hypothetical protein
MCVRPVGKLHKLTVLPKVVEGTEIQVGTEEE